MINIKKIIAESIEKMQKELGIKFGSDIKPESSFTNDIGLDSLNLVKFFFILEKRFGVEISCEEADRIKTVQDAIDCVAKLKKEI